MSNLDTAFSFLKLLHNFQKVNRYIPAFGRDGDENDAEHSYILALIAWYLVDVLSPKLNKDLVIKYALVHDLVETYAGDTYIYTTDEDHKKSKRAREEAAQQQIEKEFPGFNELHALIKEYEKKETPESKFVYALDKVIPVMTIYLASENKESYWVKHAVKFSWLAEHKKNKVSASPDVAQLWDELHMLLEKEKDRLFPND